MHRGNDTSTDTSRSVRRVLRVGIADHFGWAVAVTGSAHHVVVDRRRIALVEPGVTEAPIHYESKHLDDAGTATLVAEVRASVVRASAASLDALVQALPDSITSLSLRALPPNFPDDIALLRRAPYEARADAVMYRQVLVDLAYARDWAVHFYEAKSVFEQAAAVLGDRTDAVLDGPRASIGPPWTKDHRMALAATVVSA
jgi:hypothetical protein